MIFLSKGQRLCLGAARHIQLDKDTSKSQTEGNYPAANSNIHCRPESVITMGYTKSLGIIAIFSGPLLTAGVALGNGISNSMTKQNAEAQMIG